LDKDRILEEIIDPTVDGIVHGDLVGHGGNRDGRVEVHMRAVEF